MSIKFDEISLDKMLELIELWETQVFDDILTKKMKEGKIVFSGSMIETLH